MSSLKRIVFGSSASMVGLVVNLVAQVAMVPIFLSHWNQRTYGVWLALQGVVAMMTLVDMGHQDFVGYECLRKPVDDTDWRTRILSASLPYALASGILLVIAITGLSALGAFRSLFAGADARPAHEASISLIVFAVAWLLAQSFNGLMGRVLSSLGEAPRTTWVTIAQYLVILLAQAGAVIGGFQILGTSLIQAAATIAFNAVITVGYLRLLFRKGVRLARPDLPVGFRNLRHSFALTFSLLIETLQQTGFRVVLVPLLGPAAVAQFSTLRTVANTAQQGVNTLVNPTVPELMRVVSARNAAGTSAILSLLWFMAVVLVAPGVVLLQLVGPPVYAEWTRGKLPWDGLTFALLSLSIVINGLGQPGRSVLRGNNLLRAQIGVSIAGGTILLGGTWLLVPLLGLAGAAIALACGELARAASTLYVARRWLLRAELDPAAQVLAVSGGVAVACSATVMALARWPGSPLLPVASFSAAWIAGVFLLWLTLPDAIRGRLRAVRFRYAPRRPGA